MNRRSSLIVLLLAAVLLTISCAGVSKRMPQEMQYEMREFLTQNNPHECSQYHYNFERQAPRLHDEGKSDSLLDVIDYIKSECGPASNLEVTRILTLTHRGQFDDSLVGRATTPQLLGYRTEQEFMTYWSDLEYTWGRSFSVDNTHSRFTEFQQDLGRDIAANSALDPSARTVGLFFGGAFDSAFSLVQSEQMRDTKLRRSYDEFIGHVKQKFPIRGNVAFLMGSWNPQNENRFLGSHPEIGIQGGAESRRWRLDGVITYRFSSAAHPFIVDSLGEFVPTTRFNSWLFGAEAGLKILDFADYSTDIFASVGYDVIFSLNEAGDPPHLVAHGALGLGVGLRQRIFLNRSNGFYIGGSIRYGVADYGNPGGTDLSGNTLSVNFIAGFSLHATLHQFLEKLNYQGGWRP